MNVCTKFWIFSLHYCPMPNITQISTHMPLPNWWLTSRQCHIFYWVLQKSFYLNLIFKICGSYSTQSFQNQQFQVFIFTPLIIHLLGQGELTNLKLETQITPQGWIFWTMIFYNLKKFISRSDEGSNFDIGHWQCKNWPCSYLWHA